MYETSSIEIAEAAKVIENTQRDLNIAFMNDLAVLFDKLGIDTNEVLDAAATKWNFLNFRPGLVGGHCIGVDPYYLTFKANQVGHDPSFILSGRRINEGIPKHLAIKVCRELIHSDLLKRSSKILILGYTFKEDCPDIRNTKVAVLVSELQDLGFAVDVFDPFMKEQKIEDVKLTHYSAVIVTVGHKMFKEMGAQQMQNLEYPVRSYLILRASSVNKKVM